MNQEGHFIEACSCGEIIAQCRCPDCTKRLIMRQDGCPACRSRKRKQTTVVVPSITEHWQRLTGRDVFCCGFGASMQDFNWRRLTNQYVIACNAAITKLPTAAYHFWSDGRLYRQYWLTPYGAGTTIVMQEEGTHRMRAAYDWRHHNQLRIFTRIKGSEFQHITRDSDELWVDSTVMTGAIMLAWKLGAARVFLLGVDGYGQYNAPYYADGTPCPAGFGDVTPIGDGLGVQQRHRDWARDMLALRDYFAKQSGVPQIINLNPRSTIDAWPKQACDEVLA